MDSIDLDELSAFIVRAKAATYVGNGAPIAASRPGSHDLQFADGDWAYLDSYFGGTDFAGQEVVHLSGVPVWAENYFGRILRDDLMTGAQAGAVIKESLSALYAQGRFLGGFTHASGDARYEDTNEGTVAAFRGTEWIERGGTRVYELEYNGGLIRP